MFIEPSAVSGSSPEKILPPLGQMATPSAEVSSLKDVSFHLVDSSPSVTSALPSKNHSLPISREQVTERMQVDGFPELALIWEHAVKSAPREDLRTVAEVVEIITSHTKPLFGRPALALASFTTGAALAAHAYLPISGLATGASSAFLQLWLTGNLAMLASLSACGLQRYIVAPLMNTMSNALETMLRSENFRSVLEESPRFSAFRERREQLALTSRWDDPDYRTAYVRSNREWQSYEPPSFELQIHTLFQEFLGSKDSQTRSFVPGKNTPHLIDQKKSVTRFISRYQSELSSSRNGELDIDRGIALLRALRESEVRAGSDGDRMLSLEIDRIERRVNVKSGMIVAEVWKRDPWVDLTHQEEFYSSASLRGVKKMGRGSKGRLGTFSYLYNPAISMLDFSNDKGRVVRARCGLVQAALADGRKVSAVFVDGVEGSNAVPESVILKGLKDYALACNADVLCVNAFPLNLVPQRFARYAAAQGGKLKSVPLEFLDADSKEYLDAFGIPVQPFEYATPRGKVLSYVVDLKGSVADQLHNPTLLEKSMTSLRSLCVWGYFGQAVIGAACLIGSSVPLALIPLGIMSVAGAAYQFLFQRRSLKATGE
jgi:hypothetical protein